LPNVRRPAGRFLSPSASNPRAYRNRPLRELPILADDEDRRREVERVRATTSIRDEPESVGPAILGDWEEVRQLHRSQQHAIEVAAMRQARPMLALEDRVRDIQRRARQSGYDLRRETALMRRDIERAKAGNRHPPARVEKRCEGLEALLDGVVQREAA
jgi:hypothetical protein